MTASELKVAVRSGRRVYGTLVVSTSPRWPDMIAKLGLDFVFIDTEHIAIDRAQLAWMCQTYRALGLPPIVRIPWPDAHLATMALDGGAAGVIAPYVETVEQVQALRGAVKFRPLKGERLEAGLRDVSTLEPALRSYLAQANESSLLIINVESTPALSRLDALLSVPDLDAVLIGPHDLSCSLGEPEQYDGAHFSQAVQMICRRARAAGVGAGIHFWQSPARLAQWARDDGLNLIIYSADLTAARDKLSADLNVLRSSVGDRTGANHAADAI